MRLLTLFMDASYLPVRAWSARRLSASSTVPQSPPIAHAPKLIALAMRRVRYSTFGLLLGSGRTKDRSAECNRGTRTNVGGLGPVRRCASRPRDRGADAPCFR